MKVGFGCHLDRSCCRVALLTLVRPLPLLVFVCTARTDLGCGHLVVAWLFPGCIGLRSVQTRHCSSLPLLFRLLGPKIFRVRRCWFRAATAWLLLSGQGCCSHHRPRLETQVSSRPALHAAPRGSALGNPVRVYVQLCALTGCSPSLRCLCISSCHSSSIARSRYA